MEPRWTDTRVELLLGRLLQAGVILAAATVLFGGVLLVAQYGHATPHYAVFQGEPGGLRTLSGILGGALKLDPRSVIMLGLLILIGTPVARVFFSIVAFALERDALYVIVTLVVFGILMYSLFGPHSA